MRQDRIVAGRRSRACVKRQSSGGVGNVISNVLKKRNGISRRAPRLLCTLEPGVDTRLKFTIEPSLGKNGFQQWYDALKSVARLPTGVPKEWRKRVWLTLAEQYLHSISIDWEKTLRFAFNERSNPDDDSLGIQIVKDLHRTGCSSYSGQEGEQDRVVLKRVLLAYARWNKSVGYCQGFNVLAALILEVTQGNESEALKVMIYLIDKVLPESYFANNLRALSVDMAVFRDLLRLKLPRLSQHLHHLQKAANREAGGSYEPPLTNVFTMQWFLTMFATCLPQPAVLKIWDSVFFEGSEVLLRVALVIWERLGERIEYCQSADEFYSTMGRMTQEMLEHNLIEPTEMMQEVYSMAVFPFPQLAELREKYTYNITPFPTSVKANGSGGLGGWDSDDDVDMDDEDSVVTALGCLGPLGGLLTPELQRYQKHLKDQSNIGELSPGAVGAGGVAGSGRAEHQAAINSMMLERMSTDISALKKQYSRIKRRQQQQATQLYIRTDKCPATSILASQLHPSAPVVNHLLLGRKTKGGGPRGSRGSLTHAPAHGASPAPRPRAPTSPSPSSGPCQSGHAQAASPWRAHVRAHRRNVARARAQLGFGNSVDPEEEEDGAEPGRRDRRLSEGEERRREEEEEPPCTLPASPSQDPCVGAGQQVEQVEEVEQVEQVEQVEEGLASLELETRSGTPSPAETNPTAAPGPSPVPDPVLGSPPEPEPSPNPGLTPPPSSYRRTESDSTEPAFFEETGAMATPGPSPSSSSDTDTLLKAAPEPEPSIPALLPPPASHRRKESDSSVSGPPLLRRSPTTPDSPTPRLPSSPTTPTSPTTPDSPTPRLPSSPTTPTSPTTPDSPTPRLPSSPTTPTSPTTPVSPTTPTSPTTPASPTPRIPSSPSTPCLSPSPLSASTPTGAALNHPQQAVFSPFPSVKQPRKSAAARNLGLYGPTPRTPTVHFPQLSLNRSAGRTATRRR